MLTLALVIWAAVTGFSVYHYDEVHQQQPTTSATVDCKADMEATLAAGDKAGLHVQRMEPYPDVGYLIVLEDATNVYVHIYQSTQSPVAASDAFRKLTTCTAGPDETYIHWYAAAPKEKPAQPDARTRKSLHSWPRSQNYLPTYYSRRLSRRT